MFMAMSIQKLTSLLILIVKSLMWSEEQKNNSVITDPCDCLLDVSRCFSGV